MFPREARYLIIDDSSLSRGLLEKYLVDLGYSNITAAAGVLEAQEILDESVKQKAPIHCVISDVNMPRMTGLDLLAWVRGHSVLKELPIILCTTNHEKDKVLSAIISGATHYIIKPYDKSVLATRLADAWRRQGQKYMSVLK